MQQAHGIKLSLLLLVLWATSLQAQVQYRLQTLPDGIALGTGLGLAIGSSWMAKQVNPLSEQDILGLKPQRIPSFDRYATRHYSLAAEHFSDWAGIASLSLPVLALASPRGRQQAGSIGIIILEGVLWTSSLTNLTKSLSLRSRPYVFNPEVPLADKMRPEARLSYFSGHVSIAAYTSFVGARLFADLYPDSRWRPVVWTAAALLPACAAYGRMRSGRHYLSDVVTGYVVGAAVGWLSPRLHRARR